MPSEGVGGSRAACPGWWEIPGASVSVLRDSGSQGEIGALEGRGPREKRDEGGKREPGWVA